uniref:Mesothelin n=2 Tax=Phascolarctos cinereus TaxID=38626 RepID=A0A6P5LVK1_PHACI|nr:mesothelin isoform X2 [Phascolarctos cinereus]XP_020862512.1 mesothelin isoform X2 [Phascolarctos cinereus]
MGYLFCGPGVFFFFLALGCMATPGTHLCTRGSVDEATICASVPSISEEEVRVASTGDPSTCQVTLAQYACMPRSWLRVWKEDFLTSLYPCLVARGLPSALDPAYSTLLFSKIDLPVLETALERFSQQFSPAVLSDQWAGVLFNGLWGRLGPALQAREAQVTWSQWLSRLQPFLLHPEAFHCLAVQNTSCETFHKLTSALNDIYSSLEVEKQRKIFEGMVAFLLQEDSGSHCQEEAVLGLNSSSWLADYLGFFLERAAEEELKRLVDEPKLQMLARDPAALHLVSQLHLMPDLANFYTALLTSPPRLDLSSIPDTLICHLSPEALRNTEVKDALALAQRLNKVCFAPPPQPDGNKSVPELPSWEAIQVASGLLSSFRNFSGAVLRRLGQTALGLSVPQIERQISGQDLVTALPTLAQVRAWSPAQSRALVHKLLDSGYKVLDGQSLAALGSLVGGLNSAWLQSLDPDVVLEALKDPEFAQHFTHIPLILKTAFVEQLALAVPSPVALVQAVPDTLTDAIPNEMLAFSPDDLPKFDDLNSQRWTGVQAAMFFDKVVKNVSDFNSLSPYILHGFTCASASSLHMEQVRQLATVMERKNVTLGAEQLSCLAKRVTEDGIPEDLDSYPRDMLLFLSPSAYTRTGDCKNFFIRVGESNQDVLQKDSPLRSRLLSEALTCLGISGTRVSEEDIRILGWLACDLAGRYINSSAEVLLPRLEKCSGPFSPDQKEAANLALRSSNSPYGPPFKWSISTLNVLRGLFPVFDGHIIQKIPQNVVTIELKRALPYPSWAGQNLRDFIQNRRSSRHRRAAMPTAQCRETEITEINEDLVIYSEKELQDCLNASVLAANLDKLKDLPFTYEQERIFKAKLDKLYPDGYPEFVISNLGNLFNLVTLKEVRKWKVTSVETLKAVLKANFENDDWVMAVINNYIEGGSPLNVTFLNTVGSKYLCRLTDEQLSSIEPSALRMAEPLNPSACSQSQKNILYPKAKTAFQGIAFPEYYMLIQPYLGGAPTQDLKDLSQKNVNMDIETFKKLQEEAILPLTPEEVRGLLGQNLMGLKAEEKNSPVRAWILKQPQESLYDLGIGLTGGIPNGYIILSLRNKN